MEKKIMKGDFGTVKGISITELVDDIGTSPIGLTAMMSAKSIKMKKLV